MLVTLFIDFEQVYLYKHSSHISFIYHDSLKSSMKRRGVSAAMIMIVTAMLIATYIFQVSVVNKEISKIEPSPGNTKIVWREDGLSEENLKNVALASTIFGLELLQNMSNKNENALFSPLSIWLAMAMLYEGANGTTAEELAKVMHFPTNKSLLRENVRWLLENFGNHTGNYTLKIANSLWVQDGFPVREKYKDILREYYLAHLQLLNFLQNPEEARNIINSWVENETNGKIRNFFPPNSITPSKVAVLVNAMYFYGLWAHPFNASKTDKEHFYTPSGKILIDMMHMSGYFNYTEDRETQVLELPYQGNELSMLIVLPKDKDVTISPEKIKEWKETLIPTKVYLSFPKFKLDEKFSLKTVLENMGIRSVFTPEANMSELSPQGDIFASDVFHETYVSVDEKGTEAAAATGVPVAASIALENVRFKVDHPFLFLIQDRNTGAIFFMGWIENPMG